MRDDNALGAVDDEDAVLGHHRKVTEEDLLLLDLAGAPVHEPGGDEEGLGPVLISLLALLERVGRFAEPVVGQLERERTGEVLDR